MFFITVHAGLLYRTRTHKRSVTIPRNYFSLFRVPLTPSSSPKQAAVFRYRVFPVFRASSLAISTFYPWPRRVNRTYSRVQRADGIHAERPVVRGAITRRHFGGARLTATGDRESDKWYRHNTLYNPLPPLACSRRRPTDRSPPFRCGWGRGHYAIPRSSPIVLVRTRSTARRRRERSALTIPRVPRSVFRRDENNILLPYYRGTYAVHRFPDSPVRVRFRSGLIRFFS